MELYIAEVIDIDDVGKDGQVTDGERIRAAVMPTDRNKKRGDIPWAFPLLPKMVHVKPQVGESVLVFVMDNLNGEGQRFYIGPIISQPQFMQFDSYIGGSSRLLENATLGPETAPSIDANTIGSYAENESDVAIYGRKDTDIILGDDNLLVRCGARKFKTNGSGFAFNKKNPSFLKLKEHESLLIDKSETTATVVADDINLISNNGDPYINTTDNCEQITDEEMNKIIEKAHVLPYGDVLIDFLTMFLQMFKAHTHKYPGLPPCPDDTSKKLDMKYGTGSGEYTDEQYDYTRGINKDTRFEDVSKTFKGLGEKILSKHIRIN